MNPTAPFAPSRTTPTPSPAAPTASPVTSPPGLAPAPRSDGGGRSVRRRGTAAAGLALGAVGAVQLAGMAPAGATATTCSGAGGIIDLDCTTIYGQDLWIDDAEVRLWRWGTFAGQPVPRQVCAYNGHFFGTLPGGAAYDVHGNFNSNCAWSPVWVDSPTINRNFKDNTYFCGESVENNTHSGRYVCWMM